MIDNLLGGGDDDDSDERTDEDMDGGLFDGDEIDGDLTGDDDLMGGGEDMGFDDMDDGGGATSAEMDNRIEEIENEVASLSSTVNTVKSENEQISESVGEVEENVRKLLEVYEMVTRGVNPFVDGDEMGDAFGGGAADSTDGGSLGLFDDGQSDDSEVDDSVADADADAFFDDDLVEDADEFDDFDDFETDSEADDADSFDDDLGADLGGEFDDGSDEELDDGSNGGGEESSDGGDGKSFEELKAEYESGDADWNDGDDGNASAGGGDDGAHTDTDEKPTRDETPPVPTDDAVEAAGAAANEPSEATAERNATETTAAAGSSVTGGQSPIDGGKPYLETLPPGYVADIVVMDWLEFLVEEAGVDGAAETIAYYEAIEWVAEPAAETLQTFLNGFGGTVESDPEPRSSLTVAHHNSSLRYISRIANPDMEMVAFDDRTAREPKRRPMSDRKPDISNARHTGHTASPEHIESDGGHDPTGEEYLRSRHRRQPDRTVNGKRDVESEYTDERAE